MNTCIRKVLLASAVCFVGAPGAAAQEPASGEQEASTPVLEEIVVVGTRRKDASLDNVPVPVDVVSGEDLMNQGATDLDDLLRNTTLSYNVQRHGIDDEATLVRPATLRGLPPDSALVLVNEKRRHRSGVIAFLGSSLNSGSQGPDLFVIPAIAIDRVEILRDGASAQYGSDAIAGVINFQLRNSSQGGMLEARYGEYYEGDGGLTQVAGNVGLPLGGAGFLNLSAEYKTAGPDGPGGPAGQRLGAGGAGLPGCRAGPDLGQPGHRRCDHHVLQHGGRIAVKHRALLLRQLFDAHIGRRLLLPRSRRQRGAQRRFPHRLAAPGRGPEPQ